MQETYLQKKIDYLEAKAYQAEMQIQASQYLQTPQDENLQFLPQTDYNDDQITFQNEITPIETLNSTEVMNLPNWNSPFDSSSMTAKMAEWITTENSLYEAWKQQNYGSPRDFYKQQLADSIILKGTIEPYTRTIRNKPGDYLLVSPVTKLPIAYLYSTLVDLQESMGMEIVLHAVGRPNNNFAFPAYFIVSLEQ